MVWHISILFKFIFFSIFIGVELIYDVLVSLVQQNESVIHTHMPSFSDSFPLPVF